MKILLYISTLIFLFLNTSLAQLKYALANPLMFQEAFLSIAIAILLILTMLSLGQNEKKNIRKFSIN
jgi:positive regulator of sigma E activity